MKCTIIKPQKQHEDDVQEVSEFANMDEVGQLNVEALTSRQRQRDLRNVTDLDLGRWHDTGRFRYLLVAYG